MEAGEEGQALSALAALLLLTVLSQRPGEPGYDEGACARAGGTWRTFENACADKCLGVDRFGCGERDGGPSCECPGDACWNGAICLSPRVELRTANGPAMIGDDGSRTEALVWFYVLVALALGFVVLTVVFVVRRVPLAKRVPPPPPLPPPPSAPEPTEREPEAPAKTPQEWLADVGTAALIAFPVISAVFWMLYSDHRTKGLLPVAAALAIVVNLAAILAPAIELLFIAYRGNALAKLGLGLLFAPVSVALAGLYLLSGFRLF